MINTAINNRDYSLIQGAVLFSAIMFVFCNMLVYRLRDSESES